MTELHGGDGSFSCFDHTIEEGETAHFEHKISETYQGNSVDMPVSVVNGAQDGPAVFLTAAIHGDELNGVEVVRSVSREWSNETLNGTLVCLPVVNVPGFVTQQRYLPVHKRDMNRAFPGKTDSTSANIIAHDIWENAISQCDLGVDIHTSTRGRTNMFHIRADMEQPDTKRLARSFGARLMINTDGSSGMLRTEATEHGIPTVTIELGQAHRFERDLIDRTLQSIRSMFAEYGIHPKEVVQWPGWTEVIDGWEEKTWLRADAGGLADIHCERGDMVKSGDTICTITSPFRENRSEITAPYTGLVAGVIQNPAVYPGNPICHFVKLSDTTVRLVEKDETA